VISKSGSFLSPITKLSEKIFMQRSRLALIVVLSLVLQVVAQESRPPAVEIQPAQGDEDEVVRITTNLVQVDAVVTDKNGQQVTDLKAEDFEVLEDNRPQAITNFSYISAAGANVEANASPRVAKGVPIKPAAPLRPEQVRRTIALVADDLGLSVGSMTFLRRALGKAVTEEIQANDLVALLRTAGGIGVLQQFTSDKRLLYSAIDRIRWQGTLNRVDSFEAIQAAPVNKFGDGMVVAGGGLGPSLGEDKVAKLRADSARLREEVYTFGTINSLRYIINGLKNLPGRKSILLFSDSFKYTEENKDELHRLADHANRASVVIYTMNTRGLQTAGIMAADATSGLTGPEIDEQLAQRYGNIAGGQSALTFLSAQTGGLDIHNTNDLSAGLKRLLDDQKGYYLIGYRPDKSTFKNGSRFHDIRIKVKRPGLTVRSRRGFFGEEEKKKPEAERTRSEELLAAMTSPFQSSGIDLRLTAFFDNHQKAGSLMRSFLHIDAKALKFTPDKDGWQTAKIEVAAMTFSEAGKVVDQVTREETIQVRGGSYRRLLRNGLIYSFDVPVKKAGSYQLRVAVRDPATRLVGAANQFIEVPDLKKNRLTLSGIYARGVEPRTTATTAATITPVADTSLQTNNGGLLSKPPEIDEAVGTGQEPDAQPGVAMRRLRRGMALDYSYSIFNAQTDTEPRRTNLQKQLVVFRDGEKVYTGSLRRVAADQAIEAGRVYVMGRLDAVSDLPPGQYILQIIVTDLLSPGQTRTATQWIDFEIVNK
jgi:VWFA-related protein